MVRWYYRSIFDELEDLRHYVESLNRQIDGINAGMLLPPAGRSVAMLLPAPPPSFPVEMSETGDEVIVTVVMAAGIRKSDISLDLTSPLALEITCERTLERTDEIGRYNRAEWIHWSVVKIVSMPKPVTEDGSTAMFRDGVLEVHLKKIRHELKGKIFID